MKKVLFTATVDSHILQFHLPYLKLFKDNGYEVHVATNSKEPIEYCDKKHQISIERTPFSFNNLKAIRELRVIIEKEDFDIIHCHTPMGSVVTRIAAKRARKNESRVIYTAHGFHFYKGAPIINWLLYYPVEWYLAKYTDTLITINKEDYNRAKKRFGKRCKDIQYVPGIGVDFERFKINMTREEKNTLRKSLGLKENNCVLIQVGELNKNKNQIMSIKAMKKLVKKDSNIKLLLVGEGKLEEYYKKKIKKYNLENNIILTGYRKDIPQLLKISDLAISTSKREGLPLNLIEAMCVGLPIIATDCRGNKDLINKERLFKINNKKLLISYILEEKEKQTDKKYDTEKYCLQCIIEEVRKIYFRKKRILHVLASNKFSGAENVVCTIIENTRDIFDMVYCSPDGKINRILKEKNIKFIPLHKLGILNLKKAIEEFNPDIIHAHDYRASIIATFVIDNKIKLISHIHNNCQFSHDWNIKTTIYTLRCNRIKKIIGVSDKVYEEAIYKDFIRSKYETIYNYIDYKKVLEMSKLYVPQKRYDLFFIGRMTKEKNPFLFIQIVKKIKIKEPQIKCVMLGDGELFNRCKEIIEKEKLDNNIDMLGFKNNPFPIILNSKIGIMPSLWEGFGLSAIEGIILGKPILNSGVGGLKEIFKNNSDLICEDINDYVKKIIELDNIKEKKLNYENIIMTYCDRQKWLEKIIKLYQ